MIVPRSGQPSGGSGAAGGSRRGRRRHGHSVANARPDPGAQAGDFLLAHPLAVVARVVAPGRGSIERVEALTPYAVQRIAEDARVAGPGAQLDVTVRSPVAPGTLARLRAVFAGLGARGVRVRVSVTPIVPFATRRRPAA
jgi:hypothetical protein